MKPVKILIAEDDEDDKLLIEEFLMQRNDIVLLPIVENGVELFEVLETIADERDFPNIIVMPPSRS